MEEQIEFPPISNWPNDKEVSTEAHSLITIPLETQQIPSFQCLEEPSYVVIFEDSHTKDHKSRNRVPKWIPRNKDNYIRWRNILPEGYQILKKQGWKGLIGHPYERGRRGFATFYFSILCFYFIFFFLLSRFSFLFYFSCLCVLFLCHLFNCFLVLVCIYSMFVCIKFVVFLFILIFLLCVHFLQPAIERRSVSSIACAIAFMYARAHRATKHAHSALRARTTRFYPSAIERILVRSSSLDSDPPPT
jgi:hypothetical protein